MSKRLVVMAVVLAQTGLFSATQAADKTTDIPVDMSSEPSGTTSYRHQNNYYDSKGPTLIYSVQGGPASLAQALEVVSTGVWLVDSYAAGWNANDIQILGNSGSTITLSQSVGSTRGFIDPSIRNYINDYKYGENESGLFRDVGPAAYALFVGSGGTPGISGNPDEFPTTKSPAKNSQGGNGGSITINQGVFDLSVTGSVATTTSSTAYGPDAAVMYLNSTGGAGGASFKHDIDGGAGSDITLSLGQTNVSFTSTNGTGIWAGIAASSIGGTGGMCCVYGPNTSDSSTVDTDRFLIATLPTTSSNGTVYDWNDGSNIPWKDGSIISTYGKNGDAGDVSLTLDSLILTGKGVAGNTLLGITAASLGGANRVPTLIPGGGYWLEDPVGSGQHETKYYYAQYDSSQASMPGPGNSGNTTVTLTDGKISLSGTDSTPDAMVGIYAISGSKPFFLLTNITEVATVPTAKSATVSLTGTSISIDGSFSSGSAVGIWAEATGGYSSEPWRRQNPTDWSWQWSTGNQANGDVNPTYDSTIYNLGSGGKVTVDVDSSTLAITGSQAIGVAGLSSAGSHGGGQEAQSNPWGKHDGNSVLISITNDSAVTVQGTEVVGVYAASLGAGGVNFDAPTCYQLDACFANGGGEDPFNRIIDTTKQDTTGEEYDKKDKVTIKDVTPDGADGADVTFTLSDSALTVLGYQGSTSAPTAISPQTRALGIVAQSVGGAGGLVFSDSSFFHGSKGGQAGNGGAITIAASNSSITTIAESAVAVLAQSIGGGGGAGGSKTGYFVAHGGRGGNGGDGGSVKVEFANGAQVLTYGDFAAGVIAQSVGGGGGHGGSAKAFGRFFSVGIGGAGGEGGKGGDVGLLSMVSDFAQTFQTHGQHAHGIILQSVGGGGGVGGSAASQSANVFASFSLSLGASGGKGGDGGNIRGWYTSDPVYDPTDLLADKGVAFLDAQDSPVYANIATNAHDSTAIILQSVGGGGGIGGSASAKSLAIGLGDFDPELKAVPTIASSFSLGGSGGAGGKGGSIHYWHFGNIGTYGDGSHGVFAQSVGGGGGSGGDSTATSQDVGSSDNNVTLTFALGGKAGAGADGGTVWLQSGVNSSNAGRLGTPTTVYSYIRTVGHDSIALFAQSIGGGGGNAGSGSGLNLSVQHQPSLPDSTKAEVGKSADDVASMDSIADLPDFVNDPADVPDNVAEKPKGSSKQGATSKMAPADAVKADDKEGEKSFWANAMMCLKKSITSGNITTSGCDEPNNIPPDSYGLKIDVGVDGGGSGVGGDVTLNLQAGGAYTTGSGSHGIFAQSVGGGGGKASSAGADGGGSSKFAATVNVGGDGGSGATGGAVTVNNYGVIVTGQPYDMDNPTATDATKFTAPAVIGGDAHGIFAQSVGGSGGAGGNADPHSAGPASAIVDLLNGKYETAALTALGLSTDDISDLKSGRDGLKWILKWKATGKAAPKLSITPTINVGGSGGSGGHGGEVSVTNNGQIQTYGHRSYGVFAQSVGGGGGIAGTASGAIVDLSLSAELSGIDFAPSINVGGSGGAGGNGGEVTFKSASSNSDNTNQPLIITRGYASAGLFAQSVGGGGGVAHEGSTFGLSATVGVDGDVSATGSIDLGNEQSSLTGSAKAHSASAQGSYKFGTQSKDGKDGKDNSGSGGAINLGVSDSILQGAVITHGDDAAGLFGQSIGGGGGVATMGCSNSTPSSATHYASACWGNTIVSGKAGQIGKFISFSGAKGIDIKVNGNLTSDVKLGGGRSGKVSLYTEQDIQTFGARSFGIALQGISGGGGFHSVPSISLAQVTMPSYQRGGVGASSSSDVGIDVNLSSSTIATRGAGAWGLFAQMVQGGGGFFGDSSQRLLMTVVPSSGSVLVGVFSGSDEVESLSGTQQYSPVVETLYLPTKPGRDGSGSDNDVTVFNEAIDATLTDSTIHVYGSQAHGIVLQSLGAAGGIWKGNDSSLNMGVSLGDLSQPTINGGPISLTLTNSHVQNYGSTAERDVDGNYVRENGEIVLSKKVTGHGVVIQSDGAGPGGAASKISVKLESGSTISTDYGIALMMVGGSYDQQNPNIVNVDDGIIYNFGSQYGQMAARDDTDSSENYWAIYAPTGYTDVTIGVNGKVHGNVLLGIATKGELTNHGELRASTVSVAKESLHNYGVIYAGGEGFMTGLYVDGSLKHYAGGEIHVDVDATATDGPMYDVITVTGLARIEGEIVPHTKSLLAANYQFLTAGTLEHSGTIRDSHIFDWELSASGNTLTTSVAADFTPAGYSLSGNQGSMADYLQRLWDGSSAEHAKLFGYAHEIEQGSHANYQTILNQLSGQVLNSQAIEMKTTFATSLTDSLSCPIVTEQGLKLNQTNCAWAKVTGTIAEQSSNSSNSGYHVTAGGIRLGAQRTLSEQWTTGFSVGYANNYLTSTGLTSNGSFFDASLSAQKKVDDWSFGASLGFAYGWFDNNRSVQLGANGAAAPMSSLYTSSTNMMMVGLKLRAAYEHEEQNHYIKPYVDLDLMYSHVPGFTEAGGALALTTKSNSQYNVAISPMVEFGTDVVTDGKRRIKAYVSGGASFLPNNNVSTQMAFANGLAGAGTYDVITDGPTVLGRLNLGIQAFESNDLEVRAQYGLQFGDGYLSQSLSANLIWRF